MGVELVPCYLQFRLYDLHIATVFVSTDDYAGVSNSGLSKWHIIIPTVVDGG